MRVFVAGATGAIGTRLVPQLVAAGHDVIGTTHSPERTESVRVLGGEPVVVDLMNPDAVLRAVVGTRPDAIVHEATALAGTADLKHFDRTFAQTNRLRTEGTEALLRAAAEVGAGRFVAQSYAGWPYERTDGTVKTESDPLDPNPVSAMSETHRAIRYLEDTVTGVDWTEGIVLRYGGFYGPGTSMWKDGIAVEMIRKRRYPVIGEGEGVWSFVRIDDAAEATVAAIEHGERGIYNIVDDSPEPVSEWLPGMAAAIGAKPPRHIPRWLGRLLGGESTVVMMTEVRGASNEKAKRELGWRPRFPSWREGLAEVSA
jgi:nucleoside-diphosphate-sugar epimerase